MKYVRTKDDTIYQVYDKVFEYKEDKRYQLVDSRFEISLNAIVKEAYTIEELCDKFVMKTPLTYYEEPHLKDLLLEYDKFHIKDGITIYGAIWTEWGLKYVAKMNNEGKLELL